MLLFITCCCVCILQAQQFTLSSDVFNNRPFISHQGEETYSNYLSKDVLLEPINNLRHQLESHYNISLKHRGEAHITVLTPPEFDILKPFISISEIDSISRSMQIERSSFIIDAIGKSSKLIDDREFITFYLIIESEALMNIRREIFNYSVKKGFKLSTFKPSNWEPHITIGYIGRDLYKSDGVNKSISSKIFDIKILNK